MQRVIMVALSCLLVVLGLASGDVWGQALTISAPFNLTDNKGPNTIGSSGHLLVFGADNIIPSGPPTTATATQGSTTFALNFDPFTIFPNLYDRGIPFDSALTGSWTITATRGAESAGPVLTPPIPAPQRLPLVQNLQISGTGVTPTLTWSLPDLAGLSVDRIRVRVSDTATRDQIFTSASLAPTTTMFTIPSGVLQVGKSYIFRILLEDRTTVTGFGTFTQNRSSTFTQTPFAPVPESASATSGPLVAAVLPSSRSVQVGTPATAFVTIINAGASTATGVGIALSTALRATLTFQTTDPLTNAVTGTPNTPVDILPGRSQSFVIALTPTAPVDPTEVAFTFVGTNAAPVGTLVGINTLQFSASATPVPDIVALAATLNNDGIVNIPGPTGTGVFAVATVNVGASGAITASADTGGASPPVSVSICQTDPASGQCISPIGPSVPTQIAANATPTFGIFVTGTGTVPFDPAVNRIFVRFKDAGGVTRGSTSVAVRTQ